jgi:molecular chaperone IbpA
MRHFDFSPLYRATVGFDQVADMMDRIMASDGGQPSYPPYNIEKTAEDAYRISIAVAGFAGDDLNVEVRERSLVVSGRKADDKTERAYMHRGIATRAFNRKFQLADHVVIKGATHENGMLHVDLHREIPETLKPRQIAISSVTDKVAEVVDATPVN